MSVEDPRVTPRLTSTGARVRSFLGWAFVISLVLHGIALPFFHMRQADTDKPQVEQVSVTHKIKVTPPTPPPPTPPPPTPKPQQTPPPVKQTNPPPVARLKVQPPKTHSNTAAGPSEAKYVPPKNGSQNGIPNGNSNTGAPAPVAATGKPAPPPPTPVPTTPPTPKPQCAVPNAPAAISGQPADADYPDMARQQGAVGTAEVKVTLTAGGSVAATSIYKSTGNASLDQSAIKAAQQTAYTPDIINCVKTAGSYLFQVQFTGN